MLIKNKKAYFDYQILETFEAGIELKGHEVKSIKSGRISMAGSYVLLKEGEAFWIGTDIPPYQQKNIIADYDPKRTRKLLLNKNELKYLTGKSEQKNLTLAPLRVYTKKGKIKLEFGLAKGRKKANKREQLKKRIVEREIERELKARG
jgi:SsrA-binding protein